ncbi:MAG: hypothetical protein GY811_11295 [Myxococcales bacterium]|nr:hypothetical protein [Myxococcales bacterium]
MRTKTWTASLALAATLAYVTPDSARADGGTAGVDLRYGSININNPFFAFLVGDDDISLIGIDIYANKELSSGLTLGGRLPIAHARFDDDAQTTLGNLTIELRYKLRSALHSRSWLDSSFSIATADDDGEGAQVAAAFGAFWIPDPGLYLPNTNTARLIYNQQWNLQRNAHANRGLSLGVAAGAQFLSIDGAEDRFRIPLIIGAHLGLSAKAQALARLSTYWTSGADDGEDDFLHLLEVGLKLAGVGQGSLEILAYLPLDERYRDTFEVWGLTFGFRTRF